MVSKEQIESFVAAVQTVIGADKVAGYTTGPKFYRITKRYAGEAHGSVYCFVCRATGNIYKAAGWKAPAPGVRGHIRNGSKGLDPYGGCFYAR